ncbi:sulfatase [uncultured Algibacter sp.]|uniref:sulfatase n=1 Tax=uncultured Algibacter sp. TaxID=298659 RepID=UPI002631333F|nr:sulfatase [uncultured Algibacter sp.]
MIKIKPFLLFLIVTLFALKVQAQKKENVLMIVIDDLNDYPLAPKFNKVITPNLDKFTSESLNFSQAYCPAPICNPSRAAVLSGVAPNRSGVYNNKDAWETSAPVNNSLPMPMAFKQNGYTTLWSGKLWHGHTTPKKAMLDIWFDEYIKHENFAPYPVNPGIPVDILRKKDGNTNFEAMDLPDEEWQDTRTANETIERLNTDYDKPFFMVCGFVRPHNPWTAPERFFDMYNLDDIIRPNMKADDWDDIPAIAEKIRSHGLDFDKLVASGKWEELIRSYLACISFVDWNLGRVLDALEDSKYAENTTVIIWSDHGFNVGEKTHVGKQALWEQTTRTLLKIKTSKLKHQGETSDKTVSLLDLYPTMVDLFKLKGVPENQLDGKSIAPLIKCPDKKWSQPVVTTYLKGNHAVRDNQFRYIKYRDESEELYDLNNDPDEFNNLANDAKYASIKAALKKHIPTTNAEPSGQNAKPKGKKKKGEKRGVKKKN